MNAKLNVFEARSEGPKVQEACFPFLKTKNNISIKKQKMIFLEVIVKNKKTWHLVYEFFDTSQGGYHPQMEPVVNKF